MWQNARELHLHLEIDDTNFPLLFQMTTESPYREDIYYVIQHPFPILVTLPILWNTFSLLDTFWWHMVNQDWKISGKAGHGFIPTMVT